MKDNKSIFLYNVNTHQIAKNFLEKGKGDKYFEYQSKGFFGAVIRSEEPLHKISREEVVMVIHTRFSNGNFRGVNIDIIPKRNSRIQEYGINVSELDKVDMVVEKNPGNIVLNGKETLTSLFFHDHRDKETTIINFLPHDRKKK